VSSSRIALALVLVLAVSTALTLAQNRYIIERDDLYGFSDKSGTPVIPPEYGAVKAFSEGLAPVYKDGAWGFIDTEGKIQISARFLHAENFSSGLAAVQVTDEWGYIDQSGKSVIEPHFLEAHRFSEGVAPVKSEEGWLFIDKAGTKLNVLAGFEDATSFNEGLAAVMVSGKWRFITHDGKKQFDREFLQATNFSQGLAAVQEKGNAKFGFIDHRGRDVVEPAFEDAKAFSEGLAAVRLDGRWGYIDTSGQLYIANHYPLFAHEFREGMAVVSDPVRGASMYIDGLGKPQFFRSTRPGDTERGTASGARCPLTLSSAPPKAEIYLIPLYIWDQGERNELAPSKLTDSALKDYLNLEAKRTEFFRGRTDLTDYPVLEQNYMAIFRLGDAIQRLKVEVLLRPNNNFSVSFEPQ
jgi:WG containing repeat